MIPEAWEIFHLWAQAFAGNRNCALPVLHKPGQPPSPSQPFRSPILEVSTQLSPPKGGRQPHQETCPQLGIPETPGAGMNGSISRDS